MKKVKVTITEKPKNITVVGESKFVNDLIKAGYTLEEARTLAKQDILDVKSYIKKYHNIEI